MAHVTLMSDLPPKKWTGRSEDGATVAITLWRPGFKGRPLRYVSHSGCDSDIAWTDTLGNRERLENLIWADERSGNHFGTGVIVPQDGTAAKWETE